MTTITKEHDQILAEALGWNCIEPSQNRLIETLYGYPPGLPPIIGRDTKQPVPNIHEDLNAMHQLWRKLDRNEKIEFETELRELVFREMIGAEYLSIQDLETDLYGLVTNARARQRARVWLTVKGYHLSCVEEERARLSRRVDQDMDATHKEGAD